MAEQTPKVATKPVDKRFEGAAVVPAGNNVSATPVSGRANPKALLRKDPNYEYRWVRHKGEMADYNVGKKEMMGYQPVKQGEVGTRTGQKSDEVVVAGDTILMKCPKGVVVERQKDNQKREKRMIDAADHQFQSQMDSLQHPSGKTADSIVFKGK